MSMYFYNLGIFDVIVLSFVMHAVNRDVTEPGNIRMRISCAKSVGCGCGCGCGFVARSKLPAIIVIVIQLS